MHAAYFDWFLWRQDMKDYMEQNYENLTSVLYAVYRATDVRFMCEQELDEARSFSRKLLEKSIMSSKITADDEFVIFPGLPTLVIYKSSFFSKYIYLQWLIKLTMIFVLQIKHELSHPWISRLDHLDHRMWIEESKTIQLRIGKASFFRCMH